MVSPLDGHSSQNVTPCFTLLPLSGLSSGSTWSRESLHDYILFTAAKFAPESTVI